MSLLKALKFGKPHGLSGNLRASVFLDSANWNILENLVDENNKHYSVEIKNHVERNVFVVNVLNVNNRNDAELLKHIELYYDSTILPELDNEEYYNYQLKDLEVYNLDGILFGTVLEVHNFGAGNILEIKLFDNQKKEFTNKTEMFIFSEDNFPSVDLVNKKITINPPEII